MAVEDFESGIEQPSAPSPASEGAKNGVTTGYSTPQSLEERERRQGADDAAFDMTEDIRYYKPIDTYEGIHRWDPEFEWEEWEEKKIV